VPLDLDIAVTPQAVKQAIATQQYPMALSFSLQLGEGEIIRHAVGETPQDAIPIVVRSLDTRLLGDFMRFLADEVVASRHMEFYLAWVSALLTYFGPFLQADPVPYQASLRALVRAVSGLERETQRAADDNHHTLAFLQSQRPFLDMQDEEDASAAASAAAASVAAASAENIPEEDVTVSSESKTARGSAKGEKKKRKV
jgi:hypothetical protein